MYIKRLSQPAPASLDNTCTLYKLIREKILLQGTYSCERAALEINSHSHLQRLISYRCS